MSEFNLLVLISEALSVLPEREAHIMRLRMGLESTLQEIGSALGISRKRVRQLELRVIRLLEYVGNGLASPANALLVSYVREAVQRGEKVAHKQRRKTVRLR